MFGVVRQIERSCRKWWLARDPRYRRNDIEIGAMLTTANLERGIMVREDAQLIGNVDVESYSTIGHHVIVWGSRGHVRIRRYTEIGPYVAIYAINHPMDYISTYNHRNLFEGRRKAFDQVCTVDIGNDVWMGHGAVVLPGVRIGDGAIIGAQSVITRDVGDYEIAVGNPARVVRKRFDDELISLLKAWQWWKLEPDALLQYEWLFSTSISDHRDEVVAYLRELTHASDVTGNARAASVDRQNVVA